MDFTIDRDTTDENGDPITVTENYSASLEGGVATVNHIVDGEAQPAVTQPWNPLPDGSRADWNDVNEVVTWYKENF
jgi:hypothetical protein